MTPRRGEGRHPLLTAWLARSITEEHEATRPGIHAEAEAIIAGSDPDIADRLERALDCCQFVHEDGPCGGSAADGWTHGQTHQHPPHGGCHPFVPLVTP